MTIEELLRKYNEIIEEKREIENILKEFRDAIGVTQPSVSPVSPVTNPFSAYPSVGDPTSPIYTNSGTVQELNMGNDPNESTLGEGFQIIPINPQDPLTSQELDMNDLLNQIRQKKQQEEMNNEDSI